MSGRPTNSRSRVGRPAKRPRLGTDHIPPPSYVTIYEQHHNINVPLKRPHPPVNLNEHFAGVYITPPSRSLHVDPELDALELPVDKGKKAARQPAGLEQFDGVVVTSSVQSVRTRWRQESDSNMEVAE